MNRYHPTLIKSKVSVQAHATYRASIPNAWTAWTDGACEPNPDGPGGWGFVLIDPAGKILEDWGGVGSSTNNRMELQAIIEAILNCPRDVPLVVCTDSQLCLLCAIGRWKRKSNLDLWAQMETICRGREVFFEWHRGHNGTEFNERADQLAAIGLAQESLPSTLEVSAN